MNNYNTRKAKEKLLNKIREDKRVLKKNRIRKFTKYVGICLVVIGLGYIYWRKEDIKSEKFNDSLIVDLKRENYVTLELSNGSINRFLDDEKLTIFNFNGKELAFKNMGQLTYSGDIVTDEIYYNKIYVPYGKRFVVILPDGTKARLNSGTSLKYPIAFLKDKAREVFLEGEAYFDVTKDKSHPFIVNASELNVQVLGTQFNISAYPDDANIQTVLVEGSVGFFEKDSKFDDNLEKLKPEHMAVWQKGNRSLEFEETDTQIHTGWMDGRLIFSHMRFKDIVKKLERSYKVDIINNYQDLNEVRFTASFDKENITQVLQAFNKNFPLDYNINEKKITIEKPKNKLPMK